jgi:hypothetical protein
MTQAHHVSIERRPTMRGTVSRSVLALFLPLALVSGVPDAMGDPLVSGDVVRGWKSIDGTKALLTEHPFSALPAPSPGTGGAQSLSFIAVIRIPETREGQCCPPA